MSSSYPRCSSSGQAPRCATGTRLGQDWLREPEHGASAAIIDHAGSRSNCRVRRRENPPGRSNVPLSRPGHLCGAGFQPAAVTLAGWKPAPQKAHAITRENPRFFALRHAGQNHFPDFGRKQGSGCQGTKPPVPLRFLNPGTLSPKPFAKCFCVAAKGRKAVRDIFEGSVVAAAFRVEFRVDGRGLHRRCLPILLPIRAIRVIRG